jgi:ABC-type Fe3+/spermidine/putrescine transport system ATPase subunit
MTSAAKLELRNVEKHFGDFHAVRSVSMAIKEGECWVLLGPSGCGKTTTLRMIAGFLPPNSGEILIDGRIVAGPGVFVPPHKRGIGMVFQSYAVWPHKTVYENVAYGLRIRKVPKDEERRQVEEALSLVHLDALANRYPAMLSGGQQQRVSLARAIVIKPTLLLLDEPLSNLDARLREQMRFDLKELQAQLNLTTIYVTHDQSEAMVIADRIVVMEHGRIVQIDEPERIYGRPRTRFVADFVGQSNLLPGTIISVDDNGNFVVQLDGVGALRASGDAAYQKPSPGARGFLCIRPEDIRLMAGHRSSPNGAWHGRVVSRVYLGANVDYRVQVDRSEIRVTSHRSQHFDPGDSVVLEVNPEDCTWLSD